MKRIIIIKKIRLSLNIVSGVQSFPRTFALSFDGSYSKMKYLKRKPMRSAPPASAECRFILPEMRQKIVGLFQSSVC